MQQITVCCFGKNEEKGKANELFLLDTITGDNVY
jgi:hypothetical protein